MADDKKIEPDFDALFAQVSPSKKPFLMGEAARKAFEDEIRQSIADGILNPDGTPILNEHGKSKQAAIEGEFDSIEIAAGRRNANAEMLARKTKPKDIKL